MAASQAWRLILSVEKGWPGEDLRSDALVPPASHLGREIAGHLGVPVKVTRADDPDTSSTRPNRLFDVEVDGPSTAQAVCDAACRAVDIHSAEGFVGLTVGVRVESPDSSQRARGEGHPFPR